MTFLKICVTYPFIQTKLHTMKNIALVIVLALISSSVFGQKANFSGSWKLNRDQSELGEQFSMAPNTVIIQHAKNTLDVERHSEWQGQEMVTKDHFTLDGAECENPGWMDSVKKSKATFDKKAKMIKITTSIPMQDGGEVTVTEDYSMEGDQLVIAASASSSYGDMSERFVFDKQ
jgi:hypothetical protein